MRGNVVERLYHEVGTADVCNMFCQCYIAARVRFGAICRHGFTNTRTKALRALCTTPDFLIVYVYVCVQVRVMAIGGGSEEIMRDLAMKQAKL